MGEKDYFDLGPLPPGDYYVVVFPDTGFTAMYYPGLEKAGSLVHVDEGEARRQQHAALFPLPSASACC
jgi:hypothetical protein